MAARLEALGIREANRRSEGFRAYSTSVQRTAGRHGGWQFGEELPEDVESRQARVARKNSDEPRISVETKLWIYTAVSVALIGGTVAYMAWHWLSHAANALR